MLICFALTATAKGELTMKATAAAAATKPAAVKVGDMVRSFDFESRALYGPRACYVEGEIVDIGRFGFRDCDRYKIEVHRRCWAGEFATVTEADNEADRYVYPPVNGTPIWRGNVTDAVELIM